MYKTKEEIEKEVEYLVLYKLNKDKTELDPNEMPEISNYIHQIRQDDLEEVKKIIKEKGLHLGYKNDILDKLDNLNK